MTIGRAEALDRAATLLTEGNLAGVAEVVTALLNADPSDVKALHLAGIVAMSALRFGAAHKYLSRAAELSPKDATIHNDLGLAYLRSSLPNEAERAIRKALTIDPGLLAAQVNLASTLARLGKYKEGEPLARDAVLKQPQLPDAHLALGSVLGGLGDYEGSLAAYRRAVALAPGRADLHAELGSALASLGEMKAASAAFKDAIKLQPGEGEWWLRLSRIPDAQPDLLELRKQLDAARDHPLHRSAMSFALARGLDDAGDKVGAMSMYIEANRAKRQTLNYTDAKTEAEFASIEVAMTADLIQERARAGCMDATPIFIVGMPRSGTSLVEQVIASHPQVFGAGELLALESGMRRVAPRNTGKLLGEILAGLNNSQVTAIGEDYVAELRNAFGEARHITDKLPGNFVLVGLIAMALPNAKIIHVRRDPVDNCLSIFRNEFGSLHPYAYDLAELGQYHRHYQRLMEHWRRVLPGKMHEVDYEALVGDTEAETRRLIAYCELEWSDECLGFFKTRRAVRTVSATQVRRPIYSDSIGVAKRYGDAISPLLDVLRHGMSGSA